MSATSMFPIFSAHHAAHLDALGPFGGEERGQAPVRWRRTPEGITFLPELVSGSDEQETDADRQVAGAPQRGRKIHVTPRTPSPIPENGPTARFPSWLWLWLWFSHLETILQRNRREMALKPRTWISLWFLITAPIIFWDVGYCFMRPRSMKGGDLHWIWSPYALYQEVDYVYGVKAVEEGSGFTAAQSLLNVIETLMNLAYLYLIHVKGSPTGYVVGFAAVVMTLSKTVLYWAQEYFCGFCAIGHNTWKDLTLLWIIPNGFWIVVPAIITVQLGKDLIGQLYAADRAAKKAALEKKR